MNITGLVDSHIHLTDYEPGTDIQILINQATDAGVSHLVCNGTSEKDWPNVLELTQLHPQVIPCFGLHPWFVKDRTENCYTILDNLIHTLPCGVGEAGLDRYNGESDQSAQEEAFRVQLDIARKHNRPIMVHCVRAWGWLMDILRSEPNLPSNILIHAYGGSVDLIKPLADLGVYFSFSGKVLDENYNKSRTAIISVPPDRLLIETDAPNMLPPEQYCTYAIPTAEGVMYNHPANLTAICEGIANLLGEPIEALTDRLRDNSNRFLSPILEMLNN